MKPLLCHRVMHCHPCCHQWIDHMPSMFVIGIMENNPGQNTEIFTKRWML